MKIPVVIKIELRTIETFQEACKFLKTLEGLSEAFIFQNFVFALVDFTLFEKYSTSFKLKGFEPGHRICFQENNSNFLNIKGEDKKDFTEKGIISIYIEQPVHYYHFDSSKKKFQEKIVHETYIKEGSKYNLFNGKELENKAPKSTIHLNELTGLIGKDNGPIFDKEIEVDIVDSGINGHDQYLTAEGKLAAVDKNSVLSPVAKNSFGNGLAVYSILKSILPNSNLVHIPLSVIKEDSDIIISGALRALCQSISRTPEHREVNGLKPRIINVSFSLGNKDDKALKELLQEILSVALKKRIFIVAPSGYLSNKGVMDVTDSIDSNKYQNFIKSGGAFYNNITNVKKNQSLDNLKNFLNIPDENEKIESANPNYYPNSIFGLGSNDLSLGNSIFSSSLKVLDIANKVFIANTLEPTDAASAATAQVSALLAGISNLWPTADVNELRSSLRESAIYMGSENKNVNSLGMIHISSALSLVKEKRIKAVTKVLSNVNSDNSVYLIDFQMKEAKQNIIKRTLNSEEFKDAQARFSQIQKDHDFMEKQRHKGELESDILKIKNQNVVIDEANLSFKSAFSFEQLTYLYPEIKQSLRRLIKPEVGSAPNFNDKTYFNTVWHEKNIEARKEYLKKLTLEQKTLLKNYKYDEFNILNDSINKLNSSNLSDVLKKIFALNDGVILAGEHNDSSDNSIFFQVFSELEDIAELGLKTVYIEELQKFLQPFLDQVHSSSGPVPKIKYSQILINNYLIIQGDKKLTDLVGRLQNRKIEIVGINEEASTTARNPTNQSLRVGLMNASASEIINYNKGNGSKYLVFVGTNHATEYKADDGPIAGLSQILKIPAIHLVNDKWQVLLNEKGGKVY